MTMTTSTRLPSRRTLLRAVEERDPAWDGLFIVGVRTTGIACRPTCPSRPARPENLVFYPALDEAILAGYRPCLRCHPERESAAPSWWTRLVAEIDQDRDARWSDSDLAGRGLRPGRVRRGWGP